MAVAALLGEHPQPTDAGHRRRRSPTSAAAARSRACAAPFTPSPKAEGGRHAQMDTTRLHRGRHPRRRRLRARCRRHRVRAEPAQRRSATTAPVPNSSPPGSLITPDNLVTVLVPHCEMGQGVADRARDDGGRGDGRRLVAGARQGSAGARRLRERATSSARSPAIRFRGPLGRGFDYGTYRLARWYGLQMTGGSIVGARHRRLRHDRRRRGRPARCCSPPQPSSSACARPNARRSNSRVVHEASGQIARRSASSRRRRRSSRSRRRPALKDPDDLHHPAHGASSASTSASKVDGSAMYGIDFSAAGHVVRGGRDGARSSAASSSRSTRPPPRRCPASNASSSSTKAVAVVADSYWHARKALGALEAEIRRCRPRRRDRRRRSSRRSTRRSARRRDAGRRGEDRQGRLQGAVPRARDDGADGLHGAGRGRPRRRLGGRRRIR